MNKLYTISSEEALKLVKDTPSLFDEYHQGFNQQVASWPENPVDVFVDQIKTRGKIDPLMHLEDYLVYKINKLLLLIWDVEKHN